PGQQQRPGQPGQQPGQPQADQPSPTPPQPGQAQQPGQPQEQPSPPGRSGRPGQSSTQPQPDAAENQRGGVFNRYAAENPAAAPLTGEGFRDWSDRLRDVEEMVEDPELRSRAARIRDRARDVRVDFKRHSKTPQWDLVEEMIAQPLRELRRDVAEELLRRSAEKHAQVPIDRDPVPSEFADAVREYYENLGSGR
ncbi:MAG: hypothetical protein MI861_14060, partial [Pirellulales bacterium]|nr:hypothetical protein [Pirellulales bacterium]